MLEEKDHGFTTQEFVQIRGDEFVIKFAGQLDPATQKRLNDELLKLLKREFSDLNTSRFKIPIHGWVGMIVSPFRDLDIQIPSHVDIKFRLR